MGEDYNGSLLPKTVKNIVYLAISILTDCILRYDKSVVLIGNWSTSPLDRFQFSSEIMSIKQLSIEKTEYFENYIVKNKSYIIKDTDFKNLPTPANNFIITVPSVSLLKSGLTMLKDSLLWNQSGYYIIDNAWFQNSCLNAHIFLETVWKFEILSVVLICCDSDEKVYFYTFNPFSDKAPDIWSKDQVLKQKNNHSFSLFRRLYNQSQESCDSLYFDKTRQLNGYPIKIIKFDPSTKFSYQLNRFDLIPTSEVVATIWTELNATVHNFVFPTVKLGRLDQSGFPSDKLRDLLKGDYDMQLNLDYQRDLWRNQVSTFIQSSISYIMQKEDDLMVQRNFLTIFSARIWLSLLFCGLSLSVVLKYLMKIGYLPVTFNLWRGLLGMPMLFQPQHVVSRLVVSSFSFMLIIVNLYFQSKLWSLITAPIDTLKIRKPLDFIRHRYKLYGEHSYQQYLYDKVLRSYLRFVNDTEECLQIMMNETQVACICDCWTADKFVLDNNFLHLLSDNRFATYFVYIVRDDFSLIEIVSRLYRRMYETGIIIHIYSAFLIEPPVEKMHLRTISFEQISFAFHVLGMGLVLSSCIHFIEFFISRCLWKNKGARPIVKVTR